MNSNLENSGAVSILERLIDSDPQFERSTAKRMYAEAVRAWPGKNNTHWWKWFSEASTSLGIRTKTFDCSAQDLLLLANDLARVVCYLEYDGNGQSQWIGILGKEGQRFDVLVCDEEVTRKSLSDRELLELLDRCADGKKIRCVIIRPNENLGSVSFDSGGENSFGPLERLFSLLKPEMSDIWIIVIFAFVVSLLTLATPIAVEALVNTVAFGRFLQPVMILSIILLVFLGFQGAIQGLQTYVAEIVQRRLFARIAGDLAFRLPRIVKEESDTNYLPEVTNRFFDVVTVQKVAAQLLLDGLGLVLSTLIGMAVLGFYHPWLLGFDLLLLAAIALIIFVLGRGAVSTAIKESKHKYYMAGWLEDIARCQTAFHHEGGTEFALERADRLLHEYLEARKKHFRILMRQILFALGLQAVASTVLLGLGGWLVISGELTLGQLVAAELIVTVIVGAFAKFGKHMESFYDLLASIDKLGALFDLKMEREDGILAIENDKSVSVDLAPVSYSWSGKSTLHFDVSTRIEPGERVAFLAGAGSGKSTFLDLLSGLREPTTGSISIDGFNPRSLRPDILRTQVTLVRGEEIFHATIEENVHMHRADVTATNVRDSLDALGILDPILRLKDGLGTMLESGGVPLSQNHARMLGIARAAVGRPGLLLIDGVLDGLGEEDLQRCLNYLTDDKQPWTLVVATSREDVAASLNRTISLESLTGVA